jgi:FkbM family methyltransferase
MKMENRDKLRAALRCVLNNQVYQLGAKLLNAFQVIRLQGLGVYRTLYCPARPNETYRSVHLTGYSHPIYFRPGTNDVGTIVQNLIREEYGKIPKQIDPEFIIDAGSYIGDTSVFFANRYKDCVILALEPNPGNFSLAELNLKGYSDRVSLMRSGLWSNVGTLSLAGSYTGARIVDALGDDEVDCVDVPTLIREFDVEQIDILKLDIEGAEHEVLLTDSKEWLRKTQSIIVEFHREDTKTLCTEFLQEVGFEGYSYRSLHYFYKQIQ